MKPMICALASAAAAVASGAVTGNVVAVCQRQGYPLAELNTGYLGRYVDQPLCVDPDIDPANPYETRVSQADNRLQQEEARRYGIDGFATFPAGWRRTGFIVSARKEPVDGVFATPIFDWWTHRPNENDDRLFSMAMNDPAGFRVDGKRAFLSFNTDGHHTPEELRRILDGYEARHGGGNVVFAEILDMSLGRYRSAFQNDGDLTPAMVKEFKDHVRGYLRVVDGIMTGGTHMQRYRDPETQQRILDTAFLRRMTGLIREVMAEKEFDGKKKYLGMQVVPGYECCYDHGSNVGCDGTRTLRSTLDVAKEMRPDVLKFSEWDEFNENTCVCPTLCNGYTTRRIVRGFLDMYRTGRASMQEGDDPSVPNLVISYRKTLSPGEPLAVEVLNIADGTGKGRTRVSVNVYDEAGKLIHAFPPKEIDASKTADVRYVLNTGGITSRALQVELEYLTGDFRKGTVGEGLHPVDFALGNSWNEKWVKHAVRDLPAMKKAKVALSSDREMSAELECGEPIRYAMVQGGDEILYIHNPDDIISRFREDDDWAVFHIACISMLTVPPGEREFSLKVEGVPEAGCEWIRERRHYKGTEYVPHWLAMSTEPVYLRIPKSRLKDAVLKVDLGGKKCGTVIKGRIPLRKAHSLGAYSLGAKGGTQVAVGRLNRQASYPSVWNRTSCSFDVKLPADRRSMMYIAQVVTMSGKVWRSRPFCWGGSPEERMLTYDFSPAAGDLIRPRNGEQWFFGRLGDFFSASTMRNRGPATSSAMAHQVSRADLLDDMRPARVRDEDGTWALVFDGKNDVACFPWETVPRFSPWEVAMEFRPDDVERRQLIFACRRHGGSSGLRGIELDKGRLVVGYCDFLGEGNRGWTSVQVKSGVVKAGEWNSLRLRHTGDALQLEVNGVKASQKSSLPSMCMSTAFLGGLDGVRYAGRVRNLRIRQFRRLLPPAEACTHVTEIPFLEGERWFGGAVNLGNEQPYDASSSPVNRRYGGGDCDISKQCWGGATVPFLLSDKGRYVWSDRPFRFSFDSGVLTVKSRAGKLEPVVAGKTLKDAYFHACRRHFPFTGTPPPEEFFTKPQFNNWIEIYIRGVNQKVCEDYADEIVTNGFPCGVHMVDGGWMLYHGALKFEPSAYPEPRRLFDKLRGYGWKSMLWFAYFVSPDSRVEYRRLRYHRHKGRGGYAQGLDYLLHVKDPRSRQAAVLRWWSGISCAYDLTNPEVFRYFVDILKKFAEEYRFDGFKFDAGNPEYVAGDCRFHESWMEPCDYATAWNNVGLHIPYNEFRSGFKTGGKPVVQRLHDQPHKWEAQGRIIKDMLVAGLLGYPYAVPDMIAGGLCGSFPPGCVIDGKLFVRSCQAQSLMPMMQFSLAPWRVLDKRKCDICRDYAELHVKFGPYIMDLARHAARTGEPIMRSMDWEFPGQGFGDCFTQFMLGGDWLIAPVITPDDAVTVRLPAGRWRDDLGEEHEGPKTLALKDVPLERLPRFRRLK